MDLPSSPLRCNVELKARLARPQDAIRIALDLGADDRGEEEQTDTYFALGRERLKLREITRCGAGLDGERGGSAGAAAGASSEPGESWLIRYARPDAPAARKSQYRVLPVRDPASFRALMTRQWGVKAVVRKRRRVFVWEDRVRIHIDAVDGLGTFLEFEAVLDPSRPAYDEAAAHLDVARLAHDFGVADADLVATSYSALVLASSGVPSGT